MANVAEQLNKRIGANIRTQRTIAGMGMNQLGKALENPLSGQQISKYELGVDRVSGQVLWEMSRALKCTVEDFFAGTDEILPNEAQSRALDKSEGALISALRDILDDDVRASILEMTKAVAIQIAKNRAVQ